MIPAADKLYPNNEVHRVKKVTAAPCNDLSRFAPGLKERAKKIVEFVSKKQQKEELRLSSA